MTPTSGSGDMTEKVTYMPTIPGEKNLSVELLSMIRERHYHTTRWIFRRWLNRFEQLWTRLKATVCPKIKFKINMAATSGSRDMTEKVTYMPTLPGEKKHGIEPMK